MAKSNNTTRVEKRSQPPTKPIAEEYPFTSAYNPDTGLFDRQSMIAVKGPDGKHHYRDATASERRLYQEASRRRSSNSRPAPTISQRRCNHE